MLQSIFQNKNNFLNSPSLNKFLIIIVIVFIFLIILTIISKWKIYKIINKKGYTSIIPIYNYIVLLKVVELPTWYIIFLILPFINLIPLIHVNTKLSKKFGLGIGFGVGLTFLKVIFYPILAFDNYRYLPNFEKVGKTEINSDFLDDYINEQKY